MIELHRSRDAASLGRFSGKRLQTMLRQLATHYYDDATGKVDFKPKARQRWSGSKATLKRESAGKCAYCEADTAVVAHGDVEHFRPKDLYWWLAYSMDNYNFSCQICNQTYKSNHFPVSGPRLAGPAMPEALPAGPALEALAATLCPDPASTTSHALRKLLRSEGAHLPDPYLDDPEKLFSWEANDLAREVRLVARGRSTRARNAAQAAQTVLGLNRSELLLLRWQHYDDLHTMVRALKAVDPNHPQLPDLLRRIRNMAAPDRPFAAMKRHYLQVWGVMP